MMIFSDFHITYMDKVLFHEIISDLKKKFLTIF